MGYTYKVTNYYRVKAEGEFAWPCDTEPDRTIRLWPDDILSKSSDGTFMKQTGIGCLGIQIPDDALDGPFEDTKTLAII